MPGIGRAKSVLGTGKVLPDAGDSIDVRANELSCHIRKLESHGDVDVGANDIIVHPRKLESHDVVLEPIRPLLLENHAKHMVAEVNDSVSDRSSVSDNAICSPVVGDTSTSGSSVAHVISGSFSGSGLPVRPGIGNIGKPVTLKSNVHEIKMNPNGVQMYLYNVSVIERNELTGKEFDLGKGASNDHALEKKRDACFKVFLKVVDENLPIFNNNPNSLAYDRRSLLVVYKRSLPIGDQISLDTSIENDDGSKLSYNFKVQFVKLIDLSDLSELGNVDVAGRDRSCVQIVELISSQHLYKQKDLVSFGCKFFGVNENDMKDVGGGRLVSKGFHKSVKPISGKAGQPLLGMTIDTKNTAFFKPQTTLKALCEILSRGKKGFSESDFANYTLADNELRVARTYFKGLNVEDMCMKRNFVIRNVTQKNLSEVCAQVEDSGLIRKFTLATFYQKQCMKLQCFEEYSGGKSKYHPIETCFINKNQRVPMMKQTPAQMQEMIRVSALKPSDHQKYLEEKATERKLMNNEMSTGMGIKVAKDALIVQGRVLPPPIVHYLQGKVTVDRKGNWDKKLNQFVETGDCRKWLCLSTASCQQPELLQTFVEMFALKAKSCGIKMGDFETAMCMNLIELKSRFNQAARYEMEFILFILPDTKEGPLKDQIKYLEATYGIVTQCVLLSNVLKIASKNVKAGQVLDNIINKTNMKLGGLNYSLAIANPNAVRKWLTGERVIMLGCDVNHPPPQTAADRMKPPKEPSVVGFVGNHPKKPMLFTGEFAFQNPREEMASTTKQLTKEFLGRWVRNSTGGQLPETIIYFRDGVSDGQFEQVIKYEVNPMREMFWEMSSNGADAKIVCIVAKKRHQIRLYSEFLNSNDRASFQDYPVGTVVDNTIVDPKNHDFFLKSHLAIQGTSRATNYTVIVNDEDYGQEELEEIVNVMAHGHQIVNKPVSLPAPVYGAHEMADRGKRVWRAYNEEMCSSGSSENDPVPNWKEISEKLKVSNSERLATSKHWA